MSAFIVTNRTMTRAIAAIKWAGMADRFPDCRTDKQLGDFLYDLNAEAVAQRYREPKARVEYVEERGLAFSKVDALKGLVCLAYQCCEGRVPETEAYKLLERAEQTLSGEIVSGLPEYQRASWNGDGNDPVRLSLT